MDMPKVTSCEMMGCAYNRDKQCHALAINLGDHGCPECDTMAKEPVEAGSDDDQAGVGACRVSSCTFNDKLECAADNVAVGQFGDTAACQTYQRRS
jgi:hypothetical protein